MRAGGCEDALLEVGVGSGVGARGAADIAVGKHDGIIAGQAFVGVFQAAVFHAGDHHGGGEHVQQAALHALGGHLRLDGDGERISHSNFQHFGVLLMVVIKKFTVPAWPKRC